MLCKNSDDDLFYPYVEKPVSEWFQDCKKDLGTLEEDMYTDNFLSEFETSIYFDVCQQFVAGKILWHDWTECSKSCGSGIRFKMAKECIPSYANCLNLQVKQEQCNTEPCFYGPDSDSPPGTIISWIPKPNKDAKNELPIPDKWILCDGIQRCKTGPFVDETCSNLSDRGLIGTGYSKNDILKSYF